MQFKQKEEVLDLLREFKRTIPPLEERRVLTNHYSKVEARIDAAIERLEDADYRYMKAVIAKFRSLEVKGHVTFDELVQFTYGADSFPHPPEEE